jgi:hypothetical protein
VNRSLVLCLTSSVVAAISAATLVVSAGGGLGAAIAAYVATGSLTLVGLAGVVGIRRSRRPRGVPLRTQKRPAWA